MTPRRKNSPIIRSSFVRLMENLWTNTLLENPGEKNRWSSKNLSLRSKYYVEKSFFLQKQRAFFKNTLRTCRLLFWETCWKKSLKFQFFLSASRNIPKRVFFQNVCFSSKNSFRQLGCSFDYLHKKSPQNDRMYFSSRHEKIAEVNVFQKNFTWETFTDPLECSFNKPAPTFPARRPITLGSSCTKTSVKQVSQKSVVARIC